MYSNRNQWPQGYAEGKAEVDSLLHMIVNFGESKSYPDEIRRVSKSIAYKMFSNNMDEFEAYIKARLHVEVLEAIDVYTEGVDMKPLHVVREFMKTFELYGIEPLRKKSIFNWT